MTQFVMFNFRSSLSEHLFADVPTSLYNLTKSVPSARHMDILAILLEPIIILRFE